MCTHPTTTRYSRSWHWNARGQTSLAVLVRQLAYTTPRKEDWERTYRALQARARQTLGTPSESEPSRPASEQVRDKAPLVR